MAEDIGIAGQTAEDIPARVFEGLVVNDEAPQYIPGPNDNFDPPEYNPDYDDMPPADEVTDFSFIKSVIIISMIFRLNYL